jgi:hypothetical protein
MRKMLVTGATIAALASLPAVALATASPAQDSSPANCRTTRWTTSAVSATNDFAAITNLTTNVTSIYPVTVSVSGVVRGSTVSFRVVDHWILTQAAKPGTVRVQPVGGRATPFSFTWVAPGSSAAARGHRFTVEWRRLSSKGSATLARADVALSYTTDVCRPTG